MLKPHHYEVHGPSRDYDYTVFCEKHNNEAIDFAAEWLAEVFDELEIGERTSVEMRVVAGEVDIEECPCSACCAPVSKSEEGYISIVGSGDEARMVFTPKREIHEGRKEGK